MYKFFGLHFKSDLDLSAIGCKKNHGQNFDVRISLKKNPPKLSNCEYSIGEKYSFFNKKNIALYEVIDGSKINIYPSKNYSTYLAAETLLNFPLALCMAQRGYLVLHASTAYKENKCVTFSGKSHSGKSTIAYGLKKYGWSIISEDITVIDPDEMTILPSYPYIKLSDEAKDRLFMQDLKELQKINKSRTGYLMNQNISVKPRAQYIFFLDWMNKIDINEIGIDDVLKNLCKYSFISGSINDSKKILKLIGNCTFHSLKRPKNFVSIKQISNLLDKLSKYKNHP